MQSPNDGVMHDMITSGSMAAASSPGFFTQEDARARRRCSSTRVSGSPCSRQPPRRRRGTPTLRS
jgi:hypothetical protein